MSNLWYWVENMGDGSVAVRFCDTEIEALIRDGDQPEGWGESSVDSVWVEGQPDGSVKLG